MPLLYRDRFVSDAQKTVTQNDIDNLCLDRLRRMSEELCDETELNVKSLLSVVRNLLEVEFHITENKESTREIFPRYSDRSPLDVVIHATGDTDRLHSQRTADDESDSNVPGDDAA